MGGFKYLYSKRTYQCSTNICTTLKKNIRRDGPFDGVVGFSQGAALACALCAMSKEGFSFRFGVIFSGYLPRDASLRKVMDESLKDQRKGAAVKVFSTAGEKDLPFCRRAIPELVEAFGTGHVTSVVHPGGHELPVCSRGGEPVLKALQSFFGDQRKSVPSN